MNWIKIGEFGVDSGTFTICDPCYLESKAIVNKIVNGVQNMDNHQGNLNLSFDSGIPLAIIVSTIVGDGIFSVYERIDRDGVKEIKIRFS